MTEPGWMKGTPKTILLATDLSPRCDRALERALSLSEQWQAQLVILHAMEEPVSDIASRREELPTWRRPTDPVRLVKSQLVADLGAAAGKAEVLIEHGDAVTAIRRTAEKIHCDLIVTGVARDEMLGVFNLGGTVQQLLRASRTPLLIVKNRVRAPYRHIVAATDFSDSSRHALEAAAHLFPTHPLTIFHAYSAPLAGRMADSAAYRAEYRRVVEKERDEFLQGIKKPGPHWPAPEVLLEYGDPTLLVRDYVHEKGADLLVLGSHGRSAVFEILLGSTTQRFLEDLPCDTLVIREPRAAMGS